MSYDSFNDSLDNLRTMTGNINPSNVNLVSILMNLDNQSPMINVTSDYCSFSFKYKYNHTELLKILIE